METKYLVNRDVIQGIKLLIDKDDLTEDDVSEISTMLVEYPSILNNLSLSQVVKLDNLGIDLSPCIREQSISNMKVFIFKYASDSMKRVSNLIDTLNSIESNFYSRYTEPNRYIDPNLALSLISNIQSSINTSVGLLMKLTDNDVLMNLVLDIKQINTTINTESSDKTNIDTRKVLPKESRAKVTALFSEVMDCLSKDTEILDSDVIEAEVVSEEVS